MADLSVFDFQEEEEPRPSLMRMMRQAFGKGDRKRQKKADDEWTPSPASNRRNRSVSSSSIGSRTRSRKNAAGKGVLPVLSYKNVVQSDEDDIVSFTSGLEKDGRKRDAKGDAEVIEENEGLQMESKENELEEDKRKKVLKKELEGERWKNIDKEIEVARNLLREAWSMSRIHSLVYPPGDSDPVTITSNDIDVLRPSAFLNDTIIDFYIKHLQTRMSKDEKARSYFFNSFFFPKLVDLSTLSTDEARAALARLDKWTKEDMFKKEYIFIPVNRWSHWSLLVICDLNDMLSTDGDCHCVSTIILHFDSFMGFHSDIERIIKNYLVQEWKRRNSIEQENQSDIIKFTRVKVPQQDNMHDCGLFLLHYVELFLERCFASKSSLPEIKEDWFDPAAASAKRLQLLQLIHGMLTARLESKGESTAASPINSSPDDAEELVMFHGSSP